MNPNDIVYLLSGSYAINTASSAFTVTVNYPSIVTGSSLLGQYQFQYQNIQPQTQIAQTQNWMNSLAGMQYLWSAGNYDPRYVIQSVLPDETPEERAAEVAKLKERVAQREAAEQRAQKLLFTILTPTQVKQYTDDDYFEVPVGERLYRLRKGRSMNVELMEAGKPKIKFCAHPTDAHDLPVPDVMLSQLLALRSNEAEFLRIANRTVM